MIDLMTLIVLVLATMRATRITALDAITLPIRKVIITGFTINIKRFYWTWAGSGLNGFWSTLVHCVTCSGFWWASAVVGSWKLWPGNTILNYIYITLAVAEVAPRLLNWEPRNHNGGE